MASFPAGPVAGTVYEFGPDATQFTGPVGLMIDYDPAQLQKAQADLRLAYLADDTWLLSQNSVVDSLAHTVSDSVTHFSIYGIIGHEGDDFGDSTAVYVLDNPTPGDSSQYATLVEALAYLQTNLDHEDIGR